MMVSNRIQAPQLAKLGVIILIGFTVGFLIVSQIASNDQDNKNELKENGLNLKMVGGLGNPREKDDTIVEIVNKIKPEFETLTNKKFESIEVLSYKPQTVAGKNYFVKANVKEVNGATMIVHLRIYQDLGNNLELSAYQLDKKDEEELKYFQK